MKVRFQIRLMGPDARIEAPTVGEFLEALYQASARALRLRVEGRGSGPGKLPAWLREAASFELVGLAAGSVVLQCEAASLASVLPPGLLGMIEPAFADQPCAALLAESLAAALADDSDSALYDLSLVESFRTLARVFAAGVGGIELRFEGEAPWARVEVRPADVEKLRRLDQQLSTRAARTAEITGLLVAVDLDRRRYTLLASNGSLINGFADDRLVDQLPQLLGERVVVTGMLTTGPGGQRLVADAIRHAAPEPVGPPSSTGREGRLARISLHGFKSIRRLDDLALGPLNVLIGANGAGKSNLISFFALLDALASEALSTYVTRAGGADALLHDGAAVTPEMGAQLTFDTPAGTVDYAFRLASGAPDILLFAEEKLRLSGPEAKAPWTVLGAGHRESALIRNPDAAARAVLGMLRRAITYQFHNTSDTARIRRRWSVDDGLSLKADAANLAPFLFRLREARRDVYDRIVATVRLVAPFFADFHLEPEQGSLLLRWRERNTDIVFGPHQASDGTLRLMALVALLLQPYEDLPSLVIVDEPELGLHPYAINIVAGLFRSASVHTKVLLATQSTTFLDLFEPEEILVVDRRDRESQVKRLDPGALAAWLEEYSVSELWEKNVLGGRPAR